jgi:hypothetical protein
MNEDILQKLDNYDDNDIKKAQLKQEILRLRKNQQSEKNLYVSQRGNNKNDITLSMAKTERVDDRATRVPQGDMLVFNNDQFKSEIEKACEKQNDEFRAMMLFDDEEDEDMPKSGRGDSARKKRFVESRMVNGSEERGRTPRKKSGEKDMISYLSDSGSKDKNSMGFERFEDSRSRGSGKKRRDTNTRVPVEGETRIFSV